VTVWLMLQNPAKAAGASIAAKSVSETARQGDVRINEIAR